MGFIWQGVYYICFWQGVFLERVRWWASCHDLPLTLSVKGLFCLQDFATIDGVFVDISLRSTWELVLLPLNNNEKASSSSMDTFQSIALAGTDEFRDLEFGENKFYAILDCRHSKASFHPSVNFHFFGTSLISFATTFFNLSLWARWKACPPPLPPRLLTIGWFSAIS